MKSFVILLLLVFMQIFDAPNCGCTPTDSIKAEVESSDLVMVGDIVATNIVSKFTSPNDGTKYAIKLMAYKIKVHKSFKGIQRDKTIYLYTTLNEASCGIKLEIDQRYIVFGKKGSYLPNEMHKFLDERERLSFWANKCSKTQLFDVRVEEEIEKETIR